MKHSPLSVRPRSVIAAALLLLLTTVMVTPIHAAPFDLRFVLMPATEYSTFSRFRVTVEVVDLATGNRVSTSGIPVTLALLRCPGSPCSPVIVNNSFATANTVSGLATFSNLNIATPLDDYYFGASASGIGGETTGEFDVVTAHLVFTEVLIPSPRSILSRISRTVQVRRGSDSGPLDTLANGQTVTISLRQCIGSSGCTPTTVDPSLASGTFVNGQRTFSALVVSTIGPEYYFAASSSGATPATTSEFNVVGVDIALIPLPVTRFTGQTFAQDGVIYLAGTNTIDTMIDGVTITTDLYRCPGSGCTPTLITPVFETATVNNGEFTFSGMVINTANPGYYYVVRGPSGSGIVDSSTPFEVVEANSLTAFVTYEGRPSGPVTEPIRVILAPVTGGAFTDLTVTATNAGGSPLRGAVRVENILPGSYTLWIKYGRSLARATGEFEIVAGASSGFAMPILQMGDANDDNVVTVADFSVLAASFGRAFGSVGYDANADFNGDGVITVADFSLLAANFGVAGPTQPTP